MVIDSDPLNFNNAKPNSFSLKIQDPDNKHTKEIEFFIQDCSIPGINLGTTATNYNGYTINIQNNHLEFENFMCQMIINENFNNYVYLSNWIRNCKTTDNILDQMKDVTIFILNNNKLPIKHINLEKAFPISIGAIPLQYASVDQPVLVQVTFAYQWFDVEYII